MNSLKMPRAIAAPNKETFTIPPIAVNHHIIQGDVMKGLASLPDESVHCVVTSPPYDKLRTYGGGLQWDFAGTAWELSRVLCNGGVICWVIGDQTVNGSETLTGARQAIYFVDQVHLNLHDTMIYKKLNFSHPEKVRYHQVFEFMYIFSKGSPRTFHPIKDKRNATAGCVGNLGVNTFTEQDGSKSIRPKKVTTEWGMRGNVWVGPTRGQEEMCVPLEHPAMMPKWLARDLIRSWSGEGDTILDPFAGSGTTAFQARDLGRSSVSIELNPAYVKMIKERLRASEQLFPNQVTVEVA